jgi:hypothetical protein
MGIIGALYGRGVRQESAKDHKRWAQNPTLQKTKGEARSCNRDGYVPEDWENSLTLRYGCRGPSTP